MNMLQSQQLKSVALGFLPEGLCNVTLDCSLTLPWPQQVLAPLLWVLPCVCPLPSEFVPVSVISSCSAFPTPLEISVSNRVFLEVQLLSPCSSRVVPARRGFACLLALAVHTTDPDLENPKLCHIPITLLPTEGNCLLARTDGRKRTTVGRWKIVGVLFLKRDFSESEKAESWLG